MPAPDETPVPEPVPEPAPNAPSAEEVRALFEAPTVDEPAAPASADEMDDDEMAAFLSQMCGCGKQHTKEEVQAMVNMGRPDETGHAIRGAEVTAVLAIAEMLHVANEKILDASGPLAAGKYETALFEMKQAVMLLSKVSTLIVTLLPEDHPTRIIMNAMMQGGNALIAQGPDGRSRLATPEERAAFLAREGKVDPLEELDEKRRRGPNGPGYGTYL